VPISFRIENKFLGKKSDSLSGDKLACGVTMGKVWLGLGFLFAIAALLNVPSLNTQYQFWESSRMSVSTFNETRATFCGTSVSSNNRVNSEGEGFVAVLPESPAKFKACNDRLLAKFNASNDSSSVLASSLPVVVLGSGSAVFFIAYRLSLGKVSKAA